MTRTGNAQTVKRTSQANPENMSNPTTLIERVEFLEQEASMHKESIRRLINRNATLCRTVSMFASAVKCGEDWSDTLQKQLELCMQFDTDEKQ
jgi:predicted nucleic-acid-binding protein